MFEDEEIDEKIVRVFCGSRYTALLTSANVILTM